MINIFKHEKLQWLLLLSILTISNIGYGEIVKWTDERGKVHYGDRVPDEYKGDSEKIYVSPNVVENKNRAVKTTRVIRVKRPVVERKTSSDRDEEAKCMSDYGLSCERIKNWKKYAKVACKNKNIGRRQCENASYLEVKFKPLTKKELKRRKYNACIGNVRKNRHLDVSRCSLGSLVGT